MDYEKYENVPYSNDFLEYKFTSTGIRGDMPKLIRYSAYRSPGVYNLAMGTILDSGKVDFKSRSNNGDVSKILATTAATIYNFFEAYPETAVFLTGNIPAKTRLYQMPINTAYDQLTKDFKFYGLILNKKQKRYVQQDFKKGINYDAFLITKKR